ncbi:MAG: S24/S26 family peptidase [archaeon]|nr:S24/S26 family peptidase [archaeon]
MSEQKAKKVIKDATLRFDEMARALEKAIVEEYCAKCPKSKGKEGCELLPRETVFALFNGIWDGLASWASNGSLSLEQWWPALVCFVCQLTEKKPIIRASTKECMKPTIDEGDLVLIKRSIDPLTIDVGDIAVLRASPGDCRIRRIVEKVKKEGSIYVRTKGDFESTPDEELTSAERICGLVVQIIKKETELWKKLMGR